MSHGAGFPNNATIWRWLIGLLFAGVACAFLPVGKALALFLVFAAAVVKAFLVARHYMHLRTESVLIYAIAGIPVLLLLGLTLALVPDIIFNH